MSRAHAIGIDLGGTNARVALVDDRGTVVTLNKVKLVDRAPEAVAAVLVEQVQHLQGGLGEAAPRLPVGIGVAAQVLGDSGTVTLAPNLGWHDVPFAALVKDRLGVAPVLMNDLGAAAWGEAAAGAARNERHAILVFVGTGVGSGLILDGRLHVGQKGVAGEFGHIKVIPNGRRCGCGELGCLEAYVSGRNLAARVAERLAGGSTSVLAAGAGASDIEEAALNGDPLARELWEQAATLLQVAVANLCTVLNPRKLILGGGVLMGCPSLKEAVKHGVFDYALRVSRVDLEVVDAKLGDDAGVVGAALHALDPSAPRVNP